MSSFPNLPYPGFSPGFDTCKDGVTWYCPVSITTYGDYFNVGACAFFVAFYSILFITQLYFGVKGRTWTFTTFLAIGTAFELMGYAARLVMRPDGPGGGVWNYTAFVIQLLFLILGPTLVAAAISVTFKWIVIHCGERFSVMKPRWYPWVFLGTDFFSIIIQAIGGGVSAAATDGDTNQALLDAGTGLLIAGTAFQAANMVFCGSLIVIFMWRYIRAANRGEVGLHAHPQPGASASFGVAGAGGSAVDGAGTPGSGHSDTPTIAEGSGGGAAGMAPKRSTWEMVKPSTSFRLFLWALAAAYVAIIVRCIYRIPEMASGWGSTLMQTESLFLVFDGGAVGFAVLVLVIFHPTYFFPVMCKGSKRIAPYTGKRAEKERRKEEKEKAAAGAGAMDATAPASPA